MEDNWLKRLDKLSDVIITQTVLLGWNKAPGGFLVSLSVDSLDESISELCHELCELEAVFANVSWVIVGLQ